jgi:hypothetical protein
MLHFQRFVRIHLIAILSFLVFYVQKYTFVSVDLYVISFSLLLWPSRIIGIFNRYFKF